MSDAEAKLAFHRNALESTLMLIETHAHLDYPDFANDLDDVLRRANDAGVTRIVTIGTSLESSRRAIDLAEKHPSVFATIGVHPTSVEDADDDVITPLRELARLHFCGNLYAALHLEIHL